MCVWCVVAVFLAVKFSDFFVVYNRQLSKRNRVMAEDLNYVKLYCQNTDNMVNTGGTPECNIRSDRLLEKPLVYAFTDYMKTRGWCGENGCDERLYSMSNPFEMLIVLVIVAASIMFIIFLCIIRGGQTSTIPLSMIAPQTLPAQSYPPQFPQEPSRLGKLADALTDALRRKVGANDLLSEDQAFKKKVV
jgi:hypothetical protein